MFKIIHMQNTLIKYTIGICCLLFLLFACQSSNNKTVEPPVPNPQPTTSAPKQTVPAPDNDYMVNLFEQVDYIDIVFHNFDFSMSVTDKPNAQRNISYMSLNPVEDIACTPSLGRSYLNGSGAELAVVDIHYNGTCAYYVFVNKNGRPKLACQMSEGGINFMKQIASMQVQKAQ